MHIIEQRRHSDRLLRRPGIATQAVKFLVLSGIGFTCGVVLSLWGLQAVKGILEASSGTSVASDRAMSRNANAFQATRRESPSIADGEHSVAYRGDMAKSPADEIVEQKMSQLQEGLDRLAEANSYTATAKKREFVDGNLLDPQTVHIKCRVKPFSVYLNWLDGDAGREAIFVEGQNDGKAIAHDGGWKAKIPALSLDPNCALAMLDTRYPVTKAGIIGLAQTMLEVHRDDLQRSNIATCICDTNQNFEGRPCLEYTTTYKSQTDSPVYRKSVTCIDQEWKIPVHSRHFEWPHNENEHQSEANLDENTLIEEYSFTEVTIGCPISESDFNPKNPEYRFR